MEKKNLITRDHPSFDSFAAAFRGERGSFYARYFYEEERELERHLAGCAGSEDAAIFNCGMAAIFTLTETLFDILRETGISPHLRVSDTLYSQTKKYFQGLGSCVRFVSVTDPGFYRHDPKTELLDIVFTEIIGNGYEMPVADAHGLMKMLCESDQEGKRIFLVMDNTFLTPRLFISFPLELADRYQMADRVIFVESASKYYQRGKDTVTAGVVFGPREIIERVRTRRAMTGTYLQPICLDQLPMYADTLHSDVMPRHSRNALRLARFLERQGQVREVKYPLLPSHPQYKLADSMFGDGCGGLFFFKLKGGKEAARRFVDSLRHCRIGGSFGHDTTWVAPYDAVREDDTGIIRVAAGFKRGDFKETKEDFEQALAKVR